MEVEETIIDEALGEVDAEMEEIDSVEEVATPDLELVRELARKAFPDAIPELILGESVEAVMASVEPAREAYARVFAEATERHAEAVSRPPTVPAGGSSAPLVDVDALPVVEKLRRGIGLRSRQQ